MPRDAGEVGHVGVHQEHVASLHYHTKALTTAQNHLGRFRGAHRNTIEIVIEMQMQLKSHKQVNAIEIAIKMSMQLKSQTKVNAIEILKMPMQMKSHENANAIEIVIKMPMQLKSHKNANAIEIIIPMQLQSCQSKRLPFFEDWLQAVVRDETVTTGCPFSHLFSPKIIQQKNSISMMN